MVNNLVFSWPNTFIFPWFFLGGAHGTFKFHMELLRKIKLGIFLFLFGLLYLDGFSLRQKKNYSFLKQNTNLLSIKQNIWPNGIIFHQAGFS